MWQNFDADLTTFFIAYCAPQIPIKRPNDRTLNDVSGTDANFGGKASHY